jgi:hypothetical protein
MEHILEAT